MQKASERNVECDVLVAGGGVAGIAAALAASRNGARVVLAEKQCVLGGLATSGLVTVYLPLCDGRGHQVSFGIAEELLRLSVSSFRQKNYPAPWLEGGSEAEKCAHRYEAQFNPVYFALAAEKLLLQAGVTIYYDTLITSAHMEGGRLKGVTAECEGGKKEISCQAAVDATGNGALFLHAGLPEATSSVGNSPAGWYYASEKEGIRLQMLGFADMVEGTTRQSSNPGEGMRISGTTPEDVNLFLQLSHECTLSHIMSRGSNDSSFAEPSAMTFMPQLRMIRRILGADMVRCSSEGKHNDASIGMVSDWRMPGPVFEVPYGSLWCEGAENMYAAGRIVSCEEKMWDVMRVIPCCSVTGEAAGTAAAITAKKGSRADVSAVQCALRKSGQVLHVEEIE